MKVDYQVRRFFVHLGPLCTILLNKECCCKPIVLLAKSRNDCMCDLAIVETRRENLLLFKLKNNIQQLRKKINIEYG